MTTSNKILPLVLMVFSSILLSSCYIDDPGPIQETEKNYSVVDFDRLEMGSAFHIEVEQGDFFEINVRGDRRNIDDLVVAKEGNTLVMRYSQFRKRRHDTYISITMPVLYAVNFSGASESRINGFHDTETFDVYLSGASVCQLDITSARVNAALSGASYLSLRGEGQALHADISGASALKAFGFPVTRADVVCSGASDGTLTVTEYLKVVATGASHVVYRGEPTVDSDVSGSSEVERD